MHININITLAIYEILEEINLYQEHFVTLDIKVNEKK